MSAAPKHRQPWPMKWIILAILLCVVPYTFLTLRYRKPGKAFEPYVDLKQRANVIRLLSNGYQRIPLTAQRPVDSAHLSAIATTTAAGGLPAELRSTLVDVPQLPAEIGPVAATRGANSVQPYAIEFTCTLPDNKQLLGGAELYVKGDQIVITPTFERITGALLTRTREPIVLLTIPAGTLKPGHYRVTLTGERASRTWSLDVR